MFVSFFSAPPPALSFCPPLTLCLSFDTRKNMQIPFCLLCFVLLSYVGGWSQFTVLTLLLPYATAMWEQLWTEWERGKERERERSRECMPASTGSCYHLPLPFSLSLSPSLCCCCCSFYCFELLLHCGFWATCTHCHNHPHTGPQQNVNKTNTNKKNKTENKNMKRKMFLHALLWNQRTKLK